MAKQRNEVAEALQQAAELRRRFWGSLDHRGLCAEIARLNDDPSDKACDEIGELCGYIAERMRRERPPKKRGYAVYYRT